MNSWWSWLLTLVGVTGLYLAGKKNKAGWAVGIGAQVLWLAYAIATTQWGFVVSAFAYGWVYITNWRRWNEEAKMAENFEEDCPICRCSTTEVLEYDGDKDAYLMLCDGCGHRYWAPNDDGVWK